MVPTMEVVTSVFLCKLCLMFCLNMIQISWNFFHESVFSTWWHERKLSESGTFSPSSFPVGFRRYWVSVSKILVAVCLCISWSGSINRIITVEFSNWTLNNPMFPHVPAEGLCRYSFQVLSELAKFWDMTISYVMSVCLSTWNNSAPTEEF